MWDGKRRGDQEGQALLVVLIAVSLLGALASAMTALWLRGVTLAQRRADATTALYAAEAGVAEGLSRIFSGDRAFLQGQGQLTGQVGAGAYQVATLPARQHSETAMMIVSTGWSVERPRVARRTIRMVVDSAFFRPVVAREDLILEKCVSLLGVELVCWPRSATFSPSAIYGDDLRAGQKTASVERSTRLRMPVISYGAVAAKIPLQGDRVTLSLSGDCFIGTSGWFRLGERCESVTVAAPWAGIEGSPHVQRVTVKSGSVLVVTGDLTAKLALVPGEPAGGGGVVVAGGKIDVTDMDLVNWGRGDSITLLALDTNTPDCSNTIPGCTYDPSNPDQTRDLSNSIFIRQFSGLDVGGTVEVIAFAAPFRVPTANGPPVISLNLSSLLAELREITFRGSFVSGGDVRLEASSLLPLASWRFEVDRQLLSPLLRLAFAVPQNGIMTQISWSEESAY